MTRWNPDIHDLILADLHRHGLTDRDIAGRLLDAGYAVAVEDVATARRRLGLEPNQKAALTRRNDGERRDKPNPLAGARLWLGKRLVEKRVADRIEYRLDGCPADLTTIMRAFNKMRVAMGAEQIVANPAWEVKP